MGKGPELGETRRLVWEAVDESRMREMLAHLPGYAVVLDRALTCLWINRLDPTLSPEQVIGHHASEFIHPDDLPMAAAAIETSLQTGEVQYYETRGYAEGSLESWYRTTVVPLPAEDPDDARVLLLANDIMEQRLAERALQESERRFRQLTESSPDLIVMVDEAQRVTYVNREATRPGGLSRAQMLGRTVRELTPRNPEEAELRVAHTLRTGEPTSYETEGEARYYICRVIRLDGDAGAAQALVTITDVTEQRAAQAAQTALELQLQEAQKLDTLGRFAGGIAHDFNNLLLIIQSHLSFARKGGVTGRPITEDLDAIGKAAERAGEMTRRLLTIGRRERPNPRPVDLGLLVRDGIDLLRRMIPETIALRCEAPPEPVIVRADRGQLEQVVMNLCLNARDAIAETKRPGNIVVSVRPDDPGTGALLQVRDDGDGMSESVAARVFEPFFTTKAPGRGTGLGLSVVHTIVGQNGAALSLQTAPGAGTTFSVHFPRLLDAPVEAEAVATPVPEPTRGATILLAEDESAVRRIVTRILQTAGYRVLTAEDGKQALAVFEAHEDEIDMVLLDAVMPSLGGRDTYELLAQRRPGLKALFSSGYTGDSLPRHYVQDRALQVLPKPYRPAELIAAVERVLSQSD